MILSPHVFAISIATVCFLRLSKSLLVPPKCKKSTLRVSEDRERMPWRKDSVDSSVVSLSLRRFSNMKSIFSNYLPLLMMRNSFLQHWIVLYFFKSSRFILLLDTMTHWASVFFFFWAGLRDPIACSFLGGGSPSQNSGYKITISLCYFCYYFVSPYSASWQSSF